MKTLSTSKLYLIIVIFIVVLSAVVAFFSFDGLKLFKYFSGINSMVKTGGESDLINKLNKTPSAKPLTDDEKAAIEKSFSNQSSSKTGSGATVAPTITTKEKAAIEKSFSSQTSTVKPLTDAEKAAIENSFR